MATVKYYLSKKSQGGASEVIIRFSYKRDCVFRLRTGILVPIASWNNEKGQLKIPRLHTQEQIDLSLLKSKLDDLKNHLCTVCIEVKGSEDSAYWQDIVKVFLNGGVMPEEKSFKDETVQEAFDTFIDTRATKKERIKQMRVVQRIVLRYTLYIKKGITGKSVWIS